MKTERIAFALTIINLGLTVFLLAQLRRANAKEVVPVTTSFWQSLVAGCHTIHLCGATNPYHLLHSNRSHALKWSFAQAVLSAIWDVEDGYHVQSSNPALQLANTLRSMISHAHGCVGHSES
jgi:hypothetical protein